ncbi:MAG: hypothetical protein MJA29_07210 [Candidatus Omnitrophica bacterium]|nr:hypothetical protein [Candidatus Omnitrophota bacterium]
MKSAKKKNHEILALSRQKAPPSGSSWTFSIKISLIWKEYIQKIIITPIIDAYSRLMPPSQSNPYPKPTFLAFLVDEQTMVSSEGMYRGVVPF